MTLFVFLYEQCWLACMYIVTASVFFQIFHDYQIYWERKTLDSFRCLETLSLVSVDLCYIILLLFLFDFLLPCYRICLYFIFFSLKTCIARNKIISVIFQYIFQCFCIPRTSDIYIFVSFLDIYHLVYMYYYISYPY